MYIFINPVVENMYKHSDLNSFLIENGYTRVYIQENWLQITKEKYKQALRISKNTIIDMRCPKAYKIPKSMNIKVTYPDIEPILIHCAREISNREDLKGIKKVITTPCKSLADFGNSLNIQDTIFYSWLDFLKEQNTIFTGTQLKVSPIPLGYFEELKINHISLSGEKEIYNLFKSKIWEDLSLVELLFCKQGCHNGDGVIENVEA